MRSSAAIRLAGSGLLAALIWGACGSPTTPEPVSPPGPEPVPEVFVDWSNRPSDPIALEEGFSIQGCPGDAPFLCVLHQAEVVGQIEYLDFEAPGGDPAEALRDRVADDYLWFTQDRQDGCPEGYRTETVEPRPAAVAGTDGMRSEYAVRDAQGEVAERYVKYWAISDGRLHLLTAQAQTEASCAPGEGVAFGDQGLTAFEDSFAAIAAGSRFTSG